MELTQACVPIIKADLRSPLEGGVSAYLGSATIVNGSVVTCRHVIEAIDPTKEALLTVWDFGGPWVHIKRFRCHPKYDLAVAELSEAPRYPSLPLYLDTLNPGTLVYAAGYHLDEVEHNPAGSHVKVTPRFYFGNVVRIGTAQSNVSPSICELSFPTLSGFSGCPVLAHDFSHIVGIVHGNLEQSIRVHASYELKDGEVQFSETVNRILESGLFHRASDVVQMLSEIK